VAAEALHNAWQLIAKAGAQRFRPKITRLEHVRVSRNDQRVRWSINHRKSVPLLFS
jgi:hypothetical protein